ncbi:hypothetical protein [Flavobacterium phragmitis]|uniref:Membrane domain of glycerophosphoryl diester phosphodiesterase n=1 Tax=Flavobacterium phragmitis TaxID=739143 RepID=A0A1I1N5W4_9FLAO|nr:hypothetical protein [Flavobacterium phragmitis]SFC93009.1 hypothetical protein SAMN05216297_10398 [Flavobacterium phragmitis]
MKSTLAQIEDIKKNGYSLDFATVFNHAFENYKKIALYSGLIILVFSILFAMAFAGVMVAYFGIGSITKEFLLDLENQKFTAIELVIQTVVISAVAGITAPFGAGFLKMADSADKDIEFNVSTIFSYYRAPYFGQVFVAAFIPALVGTALSNFIESFEVLYVGNVISFMVSYFMYLSIPLVVFGNLNAIDAIKSSIVVVTKNPLNIFAFFIIGFIGSLIGIFACCVGIIFTVVFNSSMIYATYFGIFGMNEEEDSIDSIGKYNVD